MPVTVCNFFAWQTKHDDIFSHVMNLLSHKKVKGHDTLFDQ